MTLLLALLGCTLLASGTYRQSQMLFGRAPARAMRRLRLGGGLALLALALASRLGQPDAGRAVVAWFGELSLAALLVVAGMTLLARRRARAAVQPRGARAIRRPGTNQIASTDPSTTNKGGRAANAGAARTA